MFAVVLLVILFVAFCVAPFFFCVVLPTFFLFVLISFLIVMAIIVIVLVGVGVFGLSRYFAKKRKVRKANQPKLDSEFHYGDEMPYYAGAADEGAPSPSAQDPENDFRF